MDILNFFKSTFQILFELFSLIAYIVYIYGEKFVRIFISRPLKSLDGEIILITGTGNGIGKQLALQLAALGPKAKFICWDVETTSNERTVAEMRTKKVEAYAYNVDISSRETVTKMAEKIRNEVGEVTIIFNNAGICPTGPFLLQKPNSIVKTFEVNLFAHFWILFEFLPSMITRNHGHIITTASLSSALPCRDIACYAASKHGVHGFIDSLKKELHIHPSKPNKVRFSTVYPVIVETRISEPVKMTPRFPFLFPPSITAEYVAKKTIEGFRRNYEYLYMPPSAQIIALAIPLIPFEIAQKIENGLLHCDVEHTNLSKEEVNEYRNNGLHNNGSNNSKTL